MINIPARFMDADFSTLPPNIQGKFDNLFGRDDDKIGLFLHGGAGVGKTYMLFAYANKQQNIIEEQKKLGKYYGSGVLFWNTTNLLREIRNEFDNKKSGWDSLADCMDYENTLMLDDVGSEKMTEWVRETFYLLINARYEKMLATIITSNFSLQELAERIGDRTASRIAEMCEIVELVGKERRIIGSSKSQIKI